MKNFTVDDLRELAKQKLGKNFTVIVRYVDATSQKVEYEIVEVQGEKRGSLGVYPKSRIVGAINTFAKD